MNPILHRQPKDKDISKKDYYWHIHINLGTISTTAAVSNLHRVNNCNIQKLTQLTSNKVNKLGAHLTNYLIDLAVLRSTEIEGSIEEYQPLSTLFDQFL
jgi:hypothetical protein